ncbi:DSPc-domain-containing protein [Thozetella sp. PMI_491]|nr:DSPc-domain-containing protein [Thozetella sp. PMI_491]
MPSAAARRIYEDQIPSLMSVFDMDPEMMADRGFVTVDPKIMEVQAPKLPTDSQPQLRPSTLPSDATAHKHNDSTSTQTTESAESSPTTTVSCTDSSSLSDPSPSSSPDSPVNLLPLSSFGATSFGGLSGLTSLTVSDATPPERPMTSPATRRAKNMKGLSIQPPFNSLSNTLVSEPASPSFIKPVIPSMKRKPSQLSLKTNSSDLITRTTLEIPQSPSMPPILQRRALKHSTSSPHMLSALKSATFGPTGGMTIPTVLERNESGLSEFLRPSKPASQFGSTIIMEEDSPIKAQVANRAAYDFEPYHEVENNEDQKSPGYPDGPIAIYGDNVFLYLEPTAEEASRFDIVINVAHEVKNPFESLAKNQQEQAPQGKPADESPIPDTAVTTASFATAFEFQPSEDSAETPTTPKPMLFKEPEYIHMPWEHNTDIVPDLMMLCETIERKTKEGKKVLVHCQQGASRSASLIIAYGMYQNPELSVNDAYYAAQAKSKWISPNMRLMYCLQDFQKEVSKKKLGSGSIFLKPRPGKSPTKHRMTLSADNIDVSPKEPLTAPLPGEEGEDERMERSPTRARGNSTPSRGEPISPGPSSAPSSFSWTEKEDDKDAGMFGRFPTEQRWEQAQPDSGFASFSPLSRPPPSPGFAPLSLSRPPPPPGLAALSLSQPPRSPGFAPINFSKPLASPGFGTHRFGSPAGGFGLKHISLTAPSSQDDSSIGHSERHVAVMRTFPDDAALMSPRAETMTNNPLHSSPFGSGFTGLQFVEVPPTPSDGVFSPRETMFPRDPFYPFGRPTQIADPRSPPTLGETPIVRSIDEVL